MTERQPAEVPPEQAQPQPDPPPFAPDPSLITYLERGQGEPEGSTR
ncbi:MAG TPA: hypothetical protein VL337_09805 [Acidimicrobiales bacterium]|nr:hypothetical protein [Acidimicrobiales bacterium]